MHFDFNMMHISSICTYLINIISWLDTWFFHNWCFSASCWLRWCIFFHSSLYMYWLSILCINIIIPLRRLSFSPCWGVLSSVRDWMVLLFLLNSIKVQKILNIHDVNVLYELILFYLGRLRRTRSEPTLYFFMV